MNAKRWSAAHAQEAGDDALFRYGNLFNEARNAIVFVAVIFFLTSCRKEDGGDLGRNSVGLRLMPSNDYLYVLIINDSDRDILLPVAFGASGPLPQLQFFFDPKKKGMSERPNVRGFQMPQSKPRELRLYPGKAYGAFYKSETIKEYYGIPSGCYDVSAMYENMNPGDGFFGGRLKSNEVKVCFD